MKLAQINFTTIKDASGIKDPGTVEGVVSNILDYSFAIAGTLLLIFLIFSGFKMFTSGGDQKKVAEAKASLTNALVGFIVVFVAFWIVQLAGQLLGITTTNTMFGELFR